ncbi:hypothetical protein [Agromyces bracchium]|uniref:Uncharacterized protein n=1 Tax=Agromyces bracchium TaxID=88376 RepID=A0A6I3M7C8_9MICO|nr:hypothetical protein [Agromyces bracchium]MTH68007.1 hypothetical protein [Agromyces bracchium]
MGAIALGLVAMHDVGGGHGAHSAQASTAASMPATAGEHAGTHHDPMFAADAIAVVAASAAALVPAEFAGPAASDGSAGSLLLDCAVAVACALTLAFAAVLALAAGPGALGRLRVIMQAPTTSGCLAPLARLRPDLHALSISRT